MPEPAKTRPMLLLEFMLTAAGLIAVFLVLDISIPLNCSGTYCNTAKLLSDLISEGLALFVFGAVFLYVVHLYGHPAIFKSKIGIVAKAIPAALASAGFSVLLVTLFAYGQVGLGFTSFSLDILYVLYGVMTIVIFMFIEYGENLLRKIQERQNQLGV